MLTVHDPTTHDVVSYGIRIRSDADYIVVPDTCPPDAVLETGERLNTLKRSASFGFRICDSMDSTQPHIEVTRAVSGPIRVCHVGMDGAMGTLGFARWRISRWGTATMEFAQYGDPRLSGAPIYKRGTTELIGMYVCTSWAEDTRARAIPCDVFTRTPFVDAWDPRRGDALSAVSEGWDAVDGHTVVPRALELSEHWTFHETFDGRCKWSTHLYPDREFVYEDECVYLASSFKETVRTLESGTMELQWSSGDTFRVTSVRAWGFRLRPHTKPAIEIVSCEDGFPCVDWDWPRS